MTDKWPNTLRLTVRARVRYSRLVVYLAGSGKPQIECLTRQLDEAQLVQRLARRAGAESRCSSAAAVPGGPAHGSRRARFWSIACRICRGSSCSNHSPDLEILGFTHCSVLAAMIAENRILPVPVLSQCDQPGLNNMHIGHRADTTAKRSSARKCCESGYA